MDEETMILPIPYRSQWGLDAQSHLADCGPTCLAMVLNYHNIDITPDGIYAFLSEREIGAYTTYSEMMAVSKEHGVEMVYEAYTEEDALATLAANVDAGRQAIALIQYEPWQTLTGNEFKYGHFVVVTGYDDEYVYFNDPLFGLWQLADAGRNVKMSRALFMEGWGGFAPEINPNWSCIVAPEKEMAIEIEPELEIEPEPETEPVIEPEMPDEVGEPVVDGVVVVDEDVRRRIVALAAWRNAERPNLDDPAERTLWATHLGDWGETAERYTVVSGDSLRLIAWKAYGDGGGQYWTVLQTFNDLVGTNLFLGQKLHIPNRGDRAAETTDLLPRNTLVDGEKSFDPIELPSAQDYNDFGRFSDGVGFVDNN